MRRASWIVVVVVLVLVCIVHRGFVGGGGVHRASWIEVAKMTIQAKIELPAPRPSSSPAEEDRGGEWFEEKQDCSGSKNC